jgi:phage tail protein X
LRSPVWVSYGKTRAKTTGAKVDVLARRHARPPTELRGLVLAVLGMNEGVAAHKPILRQEEMLS